MCRRFMSVWFRHLTTDWLVNRRPELKELPFVFAVRERGRHVITAPSVGAELQGITTGMAAADAKALIPGLEVVEMIPGKEQHLLKAIGEWCIRYTPLVAIDGNDGLILDLSGCAHLWGGEPEYLEEIRFRLGSKGYDVRAAIADTPGTAWAMARFGRTNLVIDPGGQASALMPLPPAALRLDPVILERLQKLGFSKIESFMSMPRSVLRRRFGPGLMLRLDQALGLETELVSPLQPVTLYEERLPCLEPIRTATGIEIAIQRLLELLCFRLQQQGRGLRSAILKCYRIDGRLVQVTIGTNRASHSISHLFKLFELKICSIEPALGIELFVLEALKVEDITPEQEALWTAEECELEDPELAELLDRIAGKLGPDTIHRYLPQEHYWPERTVKPAGTLQEKPATTWRTDKPRPTRLLPRPQAIEVSVPLPDYPPMLFIYDKKTHQVKKADGPERIEREWWLEAGEHRDYYTVEDQHGARYWLFRSGHYSGEREGQWFIHGFFS